MDGASYRIARVAERLRRDAQAGAALQGRIRRILRAIKNLQTFRSGGFG